MNLKGTGEEKKNIKHKQTKINNNKRSFPSVENHKSTNRYTHNVVVFTVPRTLAVVNAECLCCTTDLL